jgi:transposase-like protein
LNCGDFEDLVMTAERTTTCPECETERSFYRVASMRVHLGLKVKWRCPECDYTFVSIDGAVDTATT